MDREKVKAELDEIVEQCRGMDYIGFSTITEHCQNILALLKEQEAVAPNPVHNSFRWLACGKCDCSITREDRFCPRCGQAVKWE